MKKSPVHKKAVRTIAPVIGHLLSYIRCFSHPRFYGRLARRLSRGGQGVLAFKVARAVYLWTEDKDALAQVAQCYASLNSKRLVNAGVSCEKELLLAIGSGPLRPVLSRAGSEAVARVVVPAVVRAMQKVVNNLASKDIVAARSRLLTLLSDVARDAESLTLLGETHYHLRNYDEAFRCTLNAVTMEPNLLAARKLRARLHQVRGEHAAALDHLTELQSHKSFSAVGSAKCAALSGQEELAKETLAAHIRAFPDDKSAFNQYLRLLDTMDDLPALRQAFLDHPVGRPLSPYAEELRRNLEAVLSARRSCPEPMAADMGRTDLLIDEIFRRSQARLSRPRRRSGRRVALVISSLGPGGAERQCVALAKALADAHEIYQVAEVRVYVANQDNSERGTFYERQLAAAGIQVIHYFDRNSPTGVDKFLGDRDLGELLSLIRPSWRARQAMQLIDCLIPFDPDVVYGMLNETIVTCSLARAALPAATIVGRWGSMPPDMHRRVSPKRIREARQLRRTFCAIRQLNPEIRFVANARAAAKANAEWLGWEHRDVETVHNGIDFSGLQPANNARREIREALGIEQNAFVFGGVLRMSEEKRPLLWVDLAQRITARVGRPVVFVLVGDGPLLGPVREAVAAQSSAMIHVVGRKSNIADFYAAMDAVLMTSSVEGMSNTVLEAQYLRLPVVCFNVGGLSETIADGITGFLIPESDLPTYVEKAAILVEQSDLHNDMASAATTFVAANFSLEALVRNTARVFGWLSPERVSDQASR